MIPRAKDTVSLMVANLPVAATAAMRAAGVRIIDNEDAVHTHSLSTMRFGKRGGGGGGGGGFWSAGLFSGFSRGGATGMEAEPGRSVALSLATTE